MYQASAAPVQRQYSVSAQYRAQRSLETAAVAVPRLQPQPFPYGRSGEDEQRLARTADAHRARCVAFLCGRAKDGEERAPSSAAAPVIEGLSLKSSRSSRQGRNTHTHTHALTHSPSQPLRVSHAHAHTHTLDLSLFLSLSLWFKLPQSRSA